MVINNKDCKTQILDECLLNEVGRCRGILMPRMQLMPLHESLEQISVGQDAPDRQAERQKIGVQRELSLVGWNRRLSLTS